MVFLNVDRVDCPSPQSRTSMAGFYRRPPAYAKKNKSGGWSEVHSPLLRRYSDVRYKAILTRSTAGNEITKVLFKIISD
jgi:hypothetical protein